jgi:hypothetical protein
MKRMMSNRRRGVVTIGLTFAVEIASGVMIVGRWVDVDVRRAKLFPGHVVAFSESGGDSVPDGSAQLSLRVGTASQ